MREAADDLLNSVVVEVDGMDHVEGDNLAFVDDEVFLEEGLDGANLLFDENIGHDEGTVEVVEETGHAG